MTQNLDWKTIQSITSFYTYLHKIDKKPITKTKPNMEHFSNTYPPKRSTMKNSLLLLAFFYVPVFANVRLSDKAGRLLGETVFPFKKLTTLDSFKNFFELVEVKKLNVSLVRSATKFVDKSFYQYSTIVTYPYFKVSSHVSTILIILTI